MTAVDVMEEVKASVEGSPTFSDCTITYSEGPGFLIDIPREGVFRVVITVQEEGDGG